MRRNLVINNNDVERLENSKSHWAEIIADLENRRGNADSIDFMAKDIDVNGNSLRTLTNVGILIVVGQKEEFIEIYDSTYRKVYANIYRYDVELPAIQTIMRKAKLEKLEAEVEALATELEIKMAELKALSI